MGKRLQEAEDLAQQSHKKLKEALQLSSDAVKTVELAVAAFNKIRNSMSDKQLADIRLLSEAPPWREER